MRAKAGRVCHCALMISTQLLGHKGMNLETLTEVRTTRDRRVNPAQAKPGR